jgi:integrase
MADFVSIGSRKSTEKNGYACVGFKNRNMEWSLYDERGRRKYLVQTERAAFLKAAMYVSGETGSFCAVLSLSGARISEVLALSAERIDEANGAINFDTLKRRKKGVIRAVPVPRGLLNFLDAVHHYRDAQQDPERADKSLWTWSRTTAWRRVQTVMRLAASPDYLSKPKSLRHAFGAEAALNRVPLTLIKKWMGHARIETTEIYTSLIGKEERALAQLTWESVPKAFQR